VVIELPEQEEPKLMMAPMIDMVFLLLIFFMCASHISLTQSIPLDIPTASKSIVPKDRPDRWIVNIQKDGALFSGSEPVSMEQLALLIAARVKEDPAVKVYIRADALTHHGAVKKVMNTLAQAGASDFIFGVYQPSAEATRQSAEGTAP
jgi:biopolymer transport protein ExbD